MSGLRRIDPVEGHDFDAWYGVYARSVDATGFGTRWQPHEVLARASDLDAPFLNHLLAYEDGGETVAVATVEQIVAVPRRSVRVPEFSVDPSRRRRGYGADALRALEPYVRSLGHSEVIVSATEGPEEVGRGPSRTFAPAHGYVVGDEGRQRILDWPTVAARLGEFEARWTPFAAGYELITFDVPTPSPWRAERIRLRSMMSTEAPHVNQEAEEEVWTEEILAHYEATTLGMGRDMIVTVARHEVSGSLVGYSELVVPRDDPSTVFQYDTLVIRDHRGHRLGGLMKVANMRELERRDLAVSVITTLNSESNTPMIAVNESLGAVTGGARIHWRKEL